MISAKKISAAVCITALSLLTGCSSQAKTSDTVLWMNGTYAVLTELNIGDYTLLGGMKNSSLNQKVEIKSLEDWWEVTDRESAEETLDWLLTEGHRTDFASLMQSLEEQGASELTEDELVSALSEAAEDEEQGKYLAKSYADYLEYGETAIDGWDYCRAMSLLGSYYIAGYYTEQEALDQSMEIAKIIQSSFTSWDELMDSYFRGYEYWSSESSQERRTIYEDIKGKENSPYQLDWNLSLEKTW